MGDTDKTTTKKPTKKQRNRRRGPGNSATANVLKQPSTSGVGTHDTSTLTAPTGKPVKESRSLPGKKDMQKFVSWAGDDKEEAEEFLAWCESDGQAKIIIGAIDYDKWLEFLKPRDASKCTLDSEENVLEQIEQIKVGAKNKKIQQKKALETYDMSSYECPGILLGKWDVDLDRVRVVDKGLAGLMESEDKKYEAAHWELKNNKWDDSDTEDKKAQVYRTSVKKEAVTKMEKLIEEYEKAEILKQIEEKKAGAIEDIIKQVELIVPGSFTSNSLCAKLWDSSKADAGSTGQIQTKEGYEAGTLKSAWLAWKTLQAAVQKTPIKGFETWTIGNGKAQDKSERADIKDRPHTSQMNFAVVWKGVTQMIHVGLKGTENPAYKG